MQEENLRINLKNPVLIVLGLFLAALSLRAQRSQPSEEVTPPEQNSSVQGAQINDLNGDGLGETLEAFTAKHPKLKCTKRNDTLSDCHVWDGVSFAGVSAKGVEKCDSETPDGTLVVDCLQGIDAHFVNNLLAGISYLLAGGDGSKDAVISALKKEFGEPTTLDKDQAVWSSDVLILSVALLKPNPKTSYVEITLDLKPSETGEDI
jgi:hypothetical protein